MKNPVKQRAVAIRWLKHPWVPLCPKPVLVEMYENKVMTQQEIAVALNTTVKRIQVAMRNFGIKSRRTAVRNQWGANNSHWKGDKAGYSALHRRLTVLRGQPRLCEMCKSTTAKKYEWSSMSGQHHNPRDYRRLCCSCHKKVDHIVENLRPKSLFGNGGDRVGSPPRPR